jgi:hypothetical protein
MHLVHRPRQVELHDVRVDDPNDLERADESRRELGACGSAVDAHGLGMVGGEMLRRHVDDVANGERDCDAVSIVCRLLAVLSALELRRGLSNDGEAVVAKVPSERVDVGWDLVGWTARQATRVDFEGGPAGGALD